LLHLCLFLIKLLVLDCQLLTLVLQDLHLLLCLNNYFFSLCAFYYLFIS
jgi:hypothetical protein